MGKKNNTENNNPIKQKPNNSNIQVIKPSSPDKPKPPGLTYIQEGDSNLKP